MLFGGAEIVPDQAEVGFGALEMIEGRRRASVIAVGIEPARIDYGIELSAPVQAAFDEYLQVVRDTAAAIVAGGER